MKIKAGFGMSNIIYNIDKIISKTKNDEIAYSRIIDFLNTNTTKSIDSITINQKLKKLVRLERIRSSIIVIFSVISLITLSISILFLSKYSNIQFMTLLASGILTLIASLSSIGLQAKKERAIKYVNHK